MKLVMDLILIIAYLVNHFIPIMELVVVITLGNFNYFKKYNNIFFISLTCNGPNYDNCLSCPSSSINLYNNICCNYYWLFLK